MCYTYKLDVFLYIVNIQFASNYLIKMALLPLKCGFSYVRFKLENNRKSEGVMNSQKSIKTKINFILFGMMIPLILFVIIFNFYTAHLLNERVSESKKSTLKVFNSTMDLELSNLERIMTNMISSSLSFKLLTQKNSELDAHLNSYNILSSYRELLDSNTFVSGCYIYSPQNNIYRSAFKSDITGVELKDSLSSHFMSCIDGQEKIQNTNWEPLVVNNRHFVYLIKGYQKTFCIFLIDLDQLSYSDYNSQNTNEEIILFHNNQILCNTNLSSSEQERLLHAGNSFYSDNHQKYMVIKDTVPGTEITSCYIMKVSNLLGSLSLIQALVLVFSCILSILLVPLGYRLLKKILFQQFDLLLDTMNKIKSGCLEARVNTSYTAKEFLELNNTFNSMIEQINALTAEAYEKELNLRQTQLQFYQIQIKPHFYLNCLKNMYAMAEVKQYDDLKEMIIYLSQHLRYILTDESMIVPISSELKYIENYISLQKIGITYDIKLETEIEKDLDSFQIPAISMLSFVENSIKYACDSKKGLTMRIQVTSLSSVDGNYVNIQISDDGKGFSPEQIEILNHYNEEKADRQSIGIHNVIERFLLFFGEENVLFAFSNMDGAQIDIYIKKERD